MAVRVGEFWEGKMKAPVAFPNICSLLDLLLSQAGERVGELLAVAVRGLPSCETVAGWQWK